MEDCLKYLDMQLDCMETPTTVTLSLRISIKLVNAVLAGLLKSSVADGIWRYNPRFCYPHCLRELELVLSSERGTRNHKLMRDFYRVQLRRWLLYTCQSPLKDICAAYDERHIIIIFLNWAYYRLQIVLIIYKLSHFILLRNRSK